MRLEPLGPAVLDDYRAAVQHPENGRLTGSHATFTREQIERWLATRGHQADRVDWAAIRISDGTYLGEAVINNVDLDNGTGSSIALAGPHVYGHGYGSEIVRMAVTHTFDVVGPPCDTCLREVRLPAPVITGWVHWRQHAAASAPSRRS